MRVRIPPLVEPGPELTASEAHRYSRTLALGALGEDGQRRLRAARVCVVGAGGLGSPVLSYLAGAGVGTIGVVDHDVVEAHNLHRQVIHDTDALGSPKAESATARLRGLDPGVEVVTHRVLITGDTAVDTFRGYHLVVDATDNVAARWAIAEACTELDLPVVWGAVSATNAQVTVFRTSWGVDLRTLWPEPPTSKVATIDQVGVLGPMTGVTGSLMAVEVIKLLTGTGRPLVGRLLYYDALAATTAELPLLAAPAPTHAAPDDAPEA